jgi:hypothetical protein
LRFQISLSHSTVDPLDFSIFRIPSATTFSPDIN